MFSYTSVMTLMRIVLAASFGLLWAIPVFAQSPRLDTPAAIERADRAFAEAMVKADVITLARTYADEYVFTDPSGRVSHKADLLDSFKRGAIKIHSQTISDVAVNVYGTVAVETGTLVSEAARDGKDSGGTFRFTRVWLTRNGRWQTIAFQETRIISTP